MKKLLVALLLCAVVAPIFADDALMIPQNVFRFRVIPSATFISQEFNEDGDRDDLESPDSINVYNLSLALEYGVTDWITAALQWTPGWQFASSIGDYEDPLSAVGGDNEDLKATGLNDLFIGAKIQIVGENAPVTNDVHRFAFATGVIVPLSTFDAKDEAESYLDGDPYRIERAGADAWGAGLRLYYDYVFNQSFFVNLYNESIFYFPRDLKSWTPSLGGTFPTFFPDTTVTESEVDYGYELTFELEPQYQTMLSDDLRFSAGLPITFVTTPEIEVDGDAQDDSETYVLSVGPTISFFLLGAPWPIDLELTYSTPIIGLNTRVQNTLILQIKNYLRFW